MGSYIDYIASMDANTLKMIINALLYLRSLYQPAMDLYTTVDNYTFGCARFLVMIAVVTVLYYFSVVAWFVSKFVILNLYALFVVVQKMAGYGATSGTAAVGDAAATVFEAASSSAAQGQAAGVSATASSLASKVAESVSAAGAAMAAGAGLAGAVGAGGDVNNAAGAVAADDAEFDF